MSDIVERLRSWVYTDSLYATAREAADEIERLRSALASYTEGVSAGIESKPTLTDAERELLARLAAERDPHVWVGVSLCPQDRLTARGLLERLK